MKLSTSAQLGDCCWVVMMLSKLPGSHQLYCKPEYVNQLQPLLSHTDHTVRPLAEWDGSGVDVWIANGQYESQGLYYTNQVDIIEFVREYMNHLAGKLGHPQPIFPSRKDMLFDIPAIPKPGIEPIVDVLAVLADPMSGQCPAFRRSEVYEKVLTPLRVRFGSVIVTNHDDNTPTGYNLAQIGILSTIARRIIAVANGPHWTTWNVHSTAERIIFLDPMRLDFGADAPVHHVADADQCLAKCISLGWL